MVLVLLVCKLNQWVTVDAGKLFYQYRWRGSLLVTITLTGHYCSEFNQLGKTMETACVL